MDTDNLILFKIKHMEVSVTTYIATWYLLFIPVAVSALYSNISITCECFSCNIYLLQVDTISLGTLEPNGRD